MPRNSIISLIVLLIISSLFSTIVFAQQSEIGVFQVQGKEDITMEAGLKQISPSHME